ncbi:hypothetical protein TNCV_270871 [Trichonephila clavipes]|nr:hypothetical protein TNCV_270871 [Trichonephila clavipes]
MSRCWTRNYGALGQTARVGIGVLCANRTREAKRDFCDLPIRRDEGRVVDPPLVFIRVFFSGKTRERSPVLDGVKGKKPCPGWRKHERRALVGTDWNRALRRLEWKGNCEKYRIQASPDPACGINEDLFACVRSTVFPDFQVSSARIPEYSCVVFYKFEGESFH